MALSSFDPGTTPELVAPPAYPVHRVTVTKSSNTYSLLISSFSGSNYSITDAVIQDVKDGLVSEGYSIAGHAKYQLAYEEF